MPPPTRRSRRRRRRRKKRNSDTHTHTHTQTQSRKTWRAQERQPKQANQHPQSGFALHVLTGRGRLAPEKGSGPPNKKTNRNNSSNNNTKQHQKAGSKENGKHRPQITKSRKPGRRKKRKTERQDGVKTSVQDYCKKETARQIDSKKRNTHKQGKSNTYLPTRESSNQGQT